jgi:hypothetical protein
MNGHTDSRRGAAHGQLSARKEGHTADSGLQVPPDVSLALSTSEDEAAAALGRRLSGNVPCPNSQPCVSTTALGDKW